jgi:hypothetical protein
MMFEATENVGDKLGGLWSVGEWDGQTDRYLCRDGEVRKCAFYCDYDRDAILADPTSAYYPTREAALAAIHAHYHGGDTETIEPGDIAATLREEGE